MDNKKMNFSKVIWLFFIGCIFGYILECSFHVIKYGFFVNKQGLIIGPFKPIYGMGLFLIPIIFHSLKIEKKPYIFLFGILFGTVFEYLSSFLLEKIWHIYIWDYSTFKFNINGRIYLPYCFVWGLICLLWYGYGYPIFLKIYDKFSAKKFFKTITIILGAFMIVDSILTWVVLFRMDHPESNNAVYRIVDKAFPEKKIKSRFSKVRKIAK